MIPEKFPNKRATSDVLATVSLSWRLFARTIGAKYRKSFLGYFWMVAPAIAITAGVTLAQRSGVISPVETGLPYPLFVFIGTLIWQIFAEAFNVPHQAFEGARSYLTRVFFPREAIILAQLYESLFTTAVRLALVLILTAVVTTGLDLRAASLVAVCFGGTVLLGLGLGALLMPFTLLFADLHNSIKLILTYGLFLSPALYHPQGDGLFATLVHWNPVSPLMLAAREAAAGEALSQTLSLLVLLGGATLTTFIGIALVRLVAPIVIERMLLGGR